MTHMEYKKQISNHKTQLYDTVHFNSRPRNNHKIKTLTKLKIYAKPKNL